MHISTKDIIPMKYMHPLNPLNKIVTFSKYYDTFTTYYAVVNVMSNFLLTICIV